MDERPERRRMNQEDHDLLIEINSDIKHILKWTTDHDKKDNDRFEAVNKEIGFHKKIIYGGLGIVAFLQFVMQFLK